MRPVAVLLAPLAMLAGIAAVAQEPSPPEPGPAERAASRLADGDRLSAAGGPDTLLAAVIAYEQAALHAAQAGDPALRARARLGKGRALLALDEPEEARPALADALAAANEAGDGP